jgi:penicillin G amidase
MAVPFSFSTRLTFTTLLALLFVISSGGSAWRPATVRARGAAQIRGVIGPVTIERDAAGVAHIRAGSELDAHFGLGYAHAQDRLWQMEFQRRLGAGRLAEILGEPALGTDSLFRTVGMRRSAAAAWARFSPAEQRPINAYVAGINAYLSSPDRQLPPEFTILGIEPEPWQPEDVVVWSKALSWGVSSNWDKELLRVQLIAKLGSPAKAAQLTPAYIDDGPTIIPGSSQAASNQREKAGKSARSSAGSLDSSIVSGLLELNRRVEGQTGLGADGFGSNNWVISGERTTTGRPLLANDPHLTSQIPANWYLARLTGGDLDVIGATVPGVPGVAIGHNGYISWGLSTVNVDSQDLYIEHVNERNEAEFRGAWQPLVIVPETIKVKGKPDVTLSVRISRHGPLISDVINPAGQPLALRWTGNDPTDNGILAGLAYNRARDWREFLEASRNNRPFDQNYVFADCRGNIGYIAAATIPMRPKGDDGRLPVEGWTGAHEWSGYVPFAELPKLYNPPQGYIVTANNKVTGDDYQHLIGTNYAAPYRAARIIEMIRRKPKLSPEDMAAMQGDVVALHARELLPMMLRTRPADERGKQAVEMLRNWDLGVTGDSAQAAVFEAWYLKLGERLFADELYDPASGDKLWDAYSENIYFVGMALEAALEKNTSWCDDVRTPQVESCADTLASALAEGLAKMADAQGADDIHAWRWDRAHQAIFPHNPFDKNPQLKPVFSRSIPNGGDKFTVNVGSVFRWDEYNQLHSAQYRQIVDYSDLSASRFLVAPGQSGNPNSPHYDDLLERWQRVQYLPMRLGAGVIDDALQARPTPEP